MACSEAVCSRCGRGGRGLGGALLLVLAVPLAAADITRAGAADRLQIGLQVALLDGLPVRVADLVVADADLTGDQVVHVVTRRALVLEVPPADARRVRPDHADRVLLPGELHQVAGDAALDLAPLVADLPLPLTLDLAVFLDQVEVAVQLVVPDARPLPAGGHLARGDTRLPACLGAAAARRREGREEERAGGHGHPKPS